MNARNGKDSTITLSVPYSYGDPNKGFKYEGAISKEEYANLMVNTYEKYKDGVYYTFNRRFGDNIAINSFKKEKRKFFQQEYYFEKTKVNIYNGKGADMTIDELIHYFQTEEPFVIIINMYRLGDEANVDLESDMKAWANESVKINESEELTPIEKIQGLSKKNLKLSFDDAKSNAVLENCKMIDYINNRKFAFLCERITFVT